MTFPLFNFNQENNMHLIRKLLLQKLESQANDNNLNAFYFCNIQDASSSLIKNKRHHQIVYKQKIRLFKSKFIPIVFYKWTIEECKKQIDVNNSISVLDLNIPIRNINIKKFLCLNNNNSNVCFFMIHGIASTHKT